MKRVKGGWRWGGWRVGGGGAGLEVGGVTLRLWYKWGTARLEVGCVNILVGERRWAEAGGKLGRSYS